MRRQWFRFLCWLGYYRTDRRRDYFIVDISKHVTMLDPDITAFTTMLMRLPSVSTSNKYHWDDEILWSDWRWVG